MHIIPCAFVLALAKAGKSNPAKIAIMAITTNSSIRVNPDLETPPRTWERDLLRNKSFIDGYNCCVSVWESVPERIAVPGSAVNSQAPGKLCVQQHTQTGGDHQPGANGRS